MILTLLKQQDGMVKGCKRFHQVIAGDGCWAISHTAGVQLR